MKIVELQDRNIAVEPVFASSLKSDDLVIIFLHEALGSIEQWKSFPQILCNSLQLNGLIYEREGHGNSSVLKSERKGDYLHRYAWEELPMLLNEVLPPEKKIILLGHSDGGTIALLYAAKFPSRIQFCVTIAAHVINEPETRKGIFPAIEAYKQGKLAGLTKYHGKKSEVLFYAWANTWLSKEFEHWGILNDIKGLNIPVIAMQGENDQYGTKMQLELIKNHCDGLCSTFFIPDCGHHPHLEKPFEVVQIILQELRIKKGTKHK